MAITDLGLVFALALRCEGFVGLVSQRRGNHGCAAAEAQTGLSTRFRVPLGVDRGWVWRRTQRAYSSRQVGPEKLFAAHRPLALCGRRNLQDLPRGYAQQGFRRTFRGHAPFYDYPRQLSQERPAVAWL